MAVSCVKKVIDRSTVINSDVLSSELFQTLKYKKDYSLERYIGSLCKPTENP